MPGSPASLLLGVLLSGILLHYVIEKPHRTTRQRRPSSPLCFSSEITFGYDGFPSTLITLGLGWPGEHNAFRKKRLAASASRLADRRKSIVAPVESTARYK